MSRSPINHSLLSPTQLKIAQWLQHNESAVMLLTEKEIAQESGVSIASVSRFWMLIGFKNLKDYKRKLREDLEITPAKKMMNTIGDLEHTKLQIHHLNKSVQLLQVTLNHFNQAQFEHAAALIQEAKKLYIYAPGPSIGLAELLNYRLARFGVAVIILRKWGSELIEDLIHIDSKCTVLIFAFSRILKEGDVLLDYAQTAGYKTIVVTDQPVLRTHRAFDALLFASRGERDEFHSMIAATYLIENLILALGERQKEADLARLHQLSALRKKYKEDLPR
ncbi:MurR/RpiR family transcriptional regulator [Sporolactobacillus shoreicorticis]|uniref:MurR/RpiR family transcriptional regulator n=1 Tax=Sporolactobacillus shoreicorticis TaxID=1923877 RepID=A0ABW5S854_9BACL|nr:MurR/RpiR family transcriptional regulator [Sporolactobacillus shoreicorticis]MCO7127389.1 MurR/RpiR family transcriptional regulator [Sporolactobacillus shoreicorticis]